MEHVPTSGVRGNGVGVPDILEFDNTDKTMSIFFANTVSGVSGLHHLKIDLTTRYGALRSLPLLEKTQNIISLHRGTIGALQSRLSAALNVTSASSENFQRARSRIVDADIAQESGALIQSQILQQTSAAILAQANQAPALTLKLLQNG